MEMGDVGAQSIEDCTAGNDGRYEVSLEAVGKKESGLLSNKDEGAKLIQQKPDD